jgi:hypothetical protein
MSYAAILQNPAPLMKRETNEIGGGRQSEGKEE